MVVEGNATSDMQQSQFKLVWIRSNPGAVFRKQGPVVQKPINANLGLNLLNLGLNFNPRLLCVVQS